MIAVSLLSVALNFQPHAAPRFSHAAVGSHPVVSMNIVEKMTQGLTQSALTEMSGRVVPTRRAPTDDFTVSEAEVRAAQASWASAIRGISATFLDGGDYVGLAASAADALYGYGCVPTGLWNRLHTKTITPSL